jgi:heme/copper-type cytochrome/quinol oxidase subunit 3
MFRIGASPAPGREPLVPSAVLGMLIFIGAEVMLFAGFISAFTIVKSSAMGVWPPPGQPRLPIETTAFNTAALVMSGVFAFLAARAFARDPASARAPLAVAIGLGAFFVLFQGYEWLQLLSEGLTLTSSTHGSFFYLIVGAHGLHALAGLALLATTGASLARGRLDSDHFAAARIFWYFVVGLWPVLYVQVYLA